MSTSGNCNSSKSKLSIIVLIIIFTASTAALIGVVIILTHSRASRISLRPTLNYRGGTLFGNIVMHLNKSL